MTDAQFDELVARLEVLAREHPSSYRYRVLFLALLGYGYIFAVLMLLGLLLVGTFDLIVLTKGNTLTLSLGGALIWSGVVILRSLWVPLESPKGVRLRPRDAPVLFNLIEEVRTGLRGPRVHRVLVTDEFNAAIVQKPRLGLLGWQQNFLILGLPLLRALSPEQFKAVLAHEYGHLSGSHSRFGAWIYRSRRTWSQLLSSLKAQEHWGSFVFNPFFNWYAPFFNAYSFVLARSNEYEADACAAELVGNQTAADALVAVATKALFINNHVLPLIYRRARDQSSPGPGLHATLPLALNEEFPKDAEAQLARALADRTSNLDTHPCLADRLSALGQAPRVPTPLARDAAIVYLGDTAHRLSQEFESRWRDQVTASWSQHHEEIQTKQHALAALQAKTEAGENLAESDLWKHARLIDELEGLKAAYPYYQKLAQLNPDHAGAQYMIGQYLLTQNDAAGLERVRRAMELDDELTLPGYRLMHDYLIAHDRENEATKIRETAAERVALERLAEAERSSVSIKDTLLPHGLTDEQVEHLRDLLRSHWQVEDAYLVRKTVQHLPERPLLVLAISRQPGDSDLNDQEFMQQLVDALALPREFLAVILTPDHHSLRKAINKVSGAMFYNRRRHRKPT